MLYKTYGGVPLITDVKVLEGGKISADALYTERSTPETILKFIKSDLEASELNFGNNVTIDRAMWTKYATLMLKAEVYMWSAKVTTGDHQATGNSDLAIAQTALQPLINQFSLLDNFSEVFSKKQMMKLFLPFVLKMEKQLIGPVLLFIMVIYSKGNAMAVMAN